MLKINLLPPHIHTKKQVRVAMFIVTVLVAAEVGGMVAARSGPAKLKTDLEAKKVDVESQKANLDKLKQQADAVQGEEAAFLPRFQFITQLMEYNRTLPALYKNTARYTYGDVTILNLGATQNQLTFDAYVSKPTDVSKLILGLSNNTRDFAQLPQVTGVPAYSAEERRRDEAMANNSNIPGTNIIGAVGEEGYPGMMPGGMSGAMGPGGYPAMGNMRDMMGAGGPGGPGGPPVGMAMGAGGYPGMAGMGAMGGGGGGTGDINLFQIDRSPRKPKGFKVTVTCLLKNPITAPDLDGARASAGGGAGGGMGMGMGGYPGMSGGMGGPMMMAPGSSMAP